MLSAAAVSALVCGVIAPASATQSIKDDGPDGSLSLELVTANGSGCTPDTTTIWSDDNNRIKVRFEDYYAEAGGDSDAGAFRRNCQMSLRLDAPAGYQYAVVKGTYRGYADIAKGSRGEQRTSYYFQGQGSTMRTHSPLAGGYDDYYSFSDEVDVSDAVWSPCGGEGQRLLNVNTELRIIKGNTNKYSYMTMGSAKFSGETDYELAWRSC